MAPPPRFLAALGIVASAVGCGLSTDGLALLDAAGLPADAATTPDDATAADATSAPTEDAGSAAHDDGGGATSDAAAKDAGDGGATTNDSGGQPIACGNVPCEVPSVCCVTTDQNDHASYACDGGSCPTFGGGSTVALECSGASTCPPLNVCCVTDQGNGRLTAACTLASACDVDGGNQVQLCDPNAPDAGCPPGVPCGSSNIHDWGLPSGSTYGTCGDVRH